MPYSRAAINPKNKCPELSLPPPTAYSVPKPSHRLPPWRRRWPSHRRKNRSDNEFCKGLSFIRLPKSAGTLGHKTACFSRQAGAAMCDAAIRFAVLREPVDRFLSAFCFLPARLQLVRSRCFRRTYIEAIPRPRIKAGAGGVACRFAVFRYSSSRNSLPLARIML